MTPDPVSPAEVYSLAAEAWNRMHPNGWTWENLTAGERDDWLESTTPIVRSVLEIQRGVSK